MKGEQNIYGNISSSAVQKYAFEMCIGGGEDFQGQISLGRAVCRVPSSGFMMPINIAKALRNPANETPVSPASRPVQSFVVCSVESVVNGE